MKVAIIYGSVRTERQGIKVVRFLETQLEARGHKVSIVDQKENALPDLDKMYKEYNGTAPEAMERIAGVLRDADSFIIVSAEYNHGIPGTLKNTLDTFQKEFYYKMSGIVTYSAGPFGGVRVAMPLRSVLAELGMPAIPTAFPISRVQDSFDDDGNAIDKAYERRIGKFLDEFEWYASAVNEKRLNT